MNQEVWFDAIVVDIDIQGGCAVEALCKKGIKTLNMVRGDTVRPFKTYPMDFSKNTKVPLAGRIKIFPN
tara:strand:- start:6600 stop:6806 length:207 start_codon:yes stop_codon:yes gene_type:complete